MMTMLLVIYKSLFAPNDDTSKNWLYTNFFIQLVPQDKVYNLIIDNNSFENVMLTKVVENLQFKIEKHLKPYKLNWLN